MQAPPLSLAMRAWLGTLSTTKVLLPLAGTALIAHMAHHDYHRAHDEQHKRVGSQQPQLTTFATLLFYVACVCDALDALAHAVIVLLLLAELCLDEETLHHHHLDHHVAHQVHHAGFLFAISATLAMVVGEVMSVRASPAPKSMKEKLLAAAKPKQH